MQQTFINLPEQIEKSITNILGAQESDEWVTHAVRLSKKYLEERDSKSAAFIQDYLDVLSYLALRVPSTYSQLVSASQQIKEVLPSFKPTTLLDIGGGPGVGIWAMKDTWSTILEAKVIDVNRDFLVIGKKILSENAVSVQTQWQHQDVRSGITTENSYDIVLIANVLNELSVQESEKVLGHAFNACKGIMLVLEPGTAFGTSIISSVAKKFKNAGYLVAPYINNSIGDVSSHWIHFPQRFIRPEFERRVRQHMREVDGIASDWEETKYAYVAISKMPAEKKAWGRVVGPVEKQKGFLTLPVLTEQGIQELKVMKRYKDKYNYAKDLKWGDVIEKSELVLT